jgi:DNA-binding transcriptional ArsR family regulator
VPPVPELTLPELVGDLKIPQLANLFKQLGDDARLTIVLVMAEHGEVGVSQLCQSLHQGQPAVIHRLNLLQMAGIVQLRGQGKKNSCRLSEDPLVADLLKTLLVRANALRLANDSESGHGGHEEVVEQPRLEEPLPPSSSEPQSIPPELLQELTTLREEVVNFHSSSLQRFQALLNNLVGKQAQSNILNRGLAKNINELARWLGGQLFSEEQPAYLRWHKGVFEAQTTNAARELLASSVGFPRLTVRPKVIVAVDEVHESPEGKGQGPRRR